MYWISDDQRSRAFALVADRPRPVRDELARARAMADRRRRIWYSGLALLIALVAAIFN
ncbi:MAG TPA: hypothetical protein VJ717_07615 [Gemmatimonadaceae bacterium]|nr:hypothetical protein [Gemmatimonadaceae bacterium]